MPVPFFMVERERTVPLRRSVKLAFEQRLAARRHTHGGVADDATSLSVAAGAGARVLDAGRAQAYSP